MFCGRRGVFYGLCALCSDYDTPGGCWWCGLDMMVATSVITHNWSAIIWTGESAVAHLEVALSTTVRAVWRLCARWWWWWPSVRRINATDWWCMPSVEKHETGNASAMTARHFLHECQVNVRDASKERLTQRERWSKNYWEFARLRCANVISRAGCIYAVCLVAIVVYIWPRPEGLTFWIMLQTFGV